MKEILTFFRNLLSKKARLSRLGVIVLSGAALFILLLIIIPVIIFSSRKPVPISAKIITSEELKDKDSVDISLMTLREREDLVFMLLTEAGYSLEGACAIMGNISVECTPYDPSLVGNSGLTYGLFQWNDMGERKTSLKKWCKENGHAHDSIEGQVAFAIHELEGADCIACRLNDYLKTTNDTYTAAEEFAVGFERCVTSNVSERPVYTGSIYPEYYGKHYQRLDLRISRALNYFNRYS